MDRNRKSFPIRIAALAGERGQVMPWLALMMTILMGISALIIDVGRGVIAHRMLQASADASAMAGAQALAQYDPSQAGIISQMNTYSAVGKTSKNYNGAFLPSVTMATGYPKVYCSSTVTGWGVDCVPMSDAPAVTANVVEVVEKESLPTIFGAVIGIPTLNLQAESMAAMRGAPRNPYNVAIIIDTTESMNDTDKDSNCGSSRLTCALQGVQVLLQNLTPCSGGAGCSGQSDVDDVSIFTFPGLVNSTDATNDASCGAQMVGAGKSGETVTYYDYPGSPASASPPPVYQTGSFSSNYRTSDSSQTLNTTTGSNASLAVEATGGCSKKYGSTTVSGLQAVGGAGTYYAGVIYAAQAALATEQSTRLAAGQDTQNIMIVLSDGDATATSTQMGTSSQNLASGVKSAQANTNKTGSYASYDDECHQAVTAAQAATKAGTTVYTVAYGAESSGCTTDSPSITPCETMEEMASSYNSSNPSANADFYSDYTATGGTNTCVSDSNSSSNLNTIFKAIAWNLSDARLIPWGTQ